jgi:hypothetical protein
MKQVALGLLTFIASLALTGFNPAQAQATNNPNILLILDTSGSMNLTASSSSQVAPYNPSTSYPDNGAGCSSTSVYYWPKSKGAAPTSCSATGMLSFDRSAYLYCKSAVSALDGAAGYYGTNDYFIRLKRTGSGISASYIWISDISNAAHNVECKADNGVYGQSMTTPDSKYPKTGNSGSQFLSSSWTTSADSQWWSDTNVGGQYYLFSPNYIRYLHAPPLIDYTRVSRLDEVKAAVSTFLSSISNSTVNVGLMRYDSNAHGGMVIQPIKPLDDAYATTLINSVNDFQPYGGTPLSETLYEAYQYLRGGPVTYGNSSQVCSSISNASSNANGSCSGSLVNLFSTASSRVGGIASSNTYNSPLVNPSAATANNLIIYLTDGEPTSDIESNTAISNLVGHTCSGGTGDGACLSDLTQYMFNHNLVSGSNSTVKTHIIGFGSDIGGSATARAYLQSAASAGGGWLYLADSNSSLRDALDAILADALGSGISSYTLSGTISGLAPGKAVTLVNNGNDVLTQDVDGEFMFSNQLAAGASYSVTVAIQPSGQICTVNNGAGIINANITNIGVNCVSTYTVSGSLTGLSASGLVLRLNSANLIVANGATTFKFASTLTSNSTYTVSVGIQPAGYICSVVNGFGTITNANITNVSVECAKTYTVGGSITGLTKAGLILKLNGGATKIVASGATSYTFSTSLTAGTAYLVTLQSPDGLICTAANNSGVMGTANLTNANIACTTQ